MAGNVRQRLLGQWRGEFELTLLPGRPSAGYQNDM